MRGLLGHVMFALFWFAFLILVLALVLALAFTTRPDWGLIYGSTAVMTITFTVLAVAHLDREKHQ